MKALRFAPAAVIVIFSALLAGPPAARAGGLVAGKPAAVAPESASVDQRWPAVAFGPSAGSGQGPGVYLVVWQDGEAYAGVKDTNLWAARVAPDGKALDPKGIAVCSAKGFQAYPSVTFDGANFLVAWQDYRNGADWDVYAARVTPAGKVLDADGFAVAAGPGNQIYPVLASDGKGALAVWCDVREGFKPEVYRLWGTRMADGKPAVAGGKELAKADVALLNPQLVFDGRNYVIAAGMSKEGWSPAVPFWARVAPDGGSSAALNGPTYMAQTFCLAADPGHGRTLVWSNGRGEHGSYSNWYVLGLLTDSNTGAAVSQMAVGFQEKFAPRNDLWPAACFDGVNFVAVVEQSPDISNADGRHGPRRVTLAATRVNPATAEPLDVGACPGDPKTNDMRKVVHSAEYAAAGAKKLSGVTVAEEAGVPLRQPQIASAGGGKSLVVFSRHGGVGQFRIQAVTLAE